MTKTELDRRVNVMEFTTVPMNSFMQGKTIPYRVRLFYRNDLFMVHQTIFISRSSGHSSDYTISHCNSGKAMCRHNNLEMLIVLCDDLYCIAPQDFDWLVQCGDSIGYNKILPALKQYIETAFDGYKKDTTS